jgi:hypothetical protein
MNVMDMDMYMDVLYIGCANCASFVILAMMIIPFSAKKKLKPGLIYES